jgi:hypothetical protein
MKTPRRPVLIAVALAAIVGAEVVPITAAAADTSTTVTLMANQPLHTMTEGVGTNMTSMITSKCHDLGESCGSAYGGLPAADDASHWNSLLNYANPLGLDWIRLQLEQNQYEPQDGVFTWNSPNMTALYREADWAKAHGVDIYLQETWQANAWNSIPGQPVAHSAPNDMTKWANGFATMVDYLVNTKGYNNIKFVNISNEPMNWWGWWKGGPDIGVGYSAARTALDAKGIHLPLAGPEYNTNNYSDSNWAKYSSTLGIWEGHEYGIKPGAYARRPISDPTVPVLWGEYGVPATTSPVNDVQNASYDSNVTMDAWIIGGMSNGVDGTAKWQYSNENDIDGKFSYVTTYDTVNKKMLDTYTASPNIYPLQEMVSRFTAKYSTSYAAASTTSSIVPSLVKSPNGAYTVLAANTDTANASSVTFKFQGLNTTKTLYRYSVTAANKDQTPVTIAPSGSFNISPNATSFTDTLATNSVYVYSSYNLAASADGVTSDGTPVPLTTQTPIASNDTVLQQDDPSVTYNGTWTTQSDATASGSSLKYTNTPGSSYQFAFTGTDFRLYGKQDNGSALGSVYIDGQFAGYANSYAPTRANQMMIFDSGALSSGAHTVKVVDESVQTVTGTGTYLNIDAIATNNSLAVNGGFEADGVATQTPTGWMEYGPNPAASQTENKGAAYAGSFNLAHYATTPYEVSTYQTVTGLPDGLYTLQAWTKSSGGQTTAVLGVRNYGGAEVRQPVPSTTSWQLTTLPNVHVTNGQADISIYSVAGASQWLNADNVQFYRQ